MTEKKTERRDLKAAHENEEDEGSDDDVGRPEDFVVVVRKKEDG
ncbi:hypothetical protein PF005_g7533 [Phytophthora fragariae]|uniref:Uncharacterized protein n=2 Tax=Phytophthora TaxID=4783 RepID=A0A6A3UBB8_9STRA|nr:hypothetical protein PF003_g33785 [Phytophthora fragariae]KAE9042919.1 hypothetical protein PR002_g3634 [Phytophthora rubi]KAE8946317.1 hypothetical protein PF009_g4059 [Phytophthora fragariae]KAE9029303.1 hypothetical protein PF011_g1146 [Phytophthora fragariae]KAE9049233.1 hypothetical protein PR001_g3510 [Phytophthora rubi]